MGYPGMALSDTRLRKRDEFLAAAAGDLLAHDTRLAGLAVQVEFDRGVAHVTGEAADRSAMVMLRRLVGRLDGVLAIWDRVRVGDRDPVSIDLGCGDVAQYPENIGIDRRASRSTSVIADLSRGLPLADHSVDRIYTVHVLEHLIDYLPLLDECHRVLRVDGILHVLAPWWRHVNAVADPTHLRFFDMQTIKSICLRPAPAPRWIPLHVGCDGATVFADLIPQPEGGQREGAESDPANLARFFD